MASSRPTIPEDILTALDETFTADSEADDYARIIYFLSVSLANGTADPFIHSLQAVVRKRHVFKRVAEQLAKDTKTVEGDPQYRQFMQDVWSKFLKEDGLVKSDHGERWDLALREDMAVTTAQYAFMRAVARMPPESYTALLGVAEALSGRLAVYAGAALTTARKAMPVVRVALLGVYLAWNIIQNIKRWWRGEITGKRCVKNIIDSGVSIAAGVAGGVGGEMAGAAIGALAGPIGAGIGAIAGGVLGAVGASHAAQVLCDKLTQWAFGLPKSEALENAYNYLGVKKDASNGDINTAYRKKSLKCHPDKGGDRDDWTKLQYYMAIIREERGE